MTDNKLQIRNSTAEFLIFTAQSGEQSIGVRYEDESVWLSQKMLAALFQVDLRTISEHLVNIFKNNELQKEAVIRKFRITAADGKRCKDARKASHEEDSSTPPSGEWLQWVIKLDTDMYSQLMDRVKSNAAPRSRL